MASWLSALSRTRSKFMGALTGLFTGTKRLDEATREELEALLIQADLPASLVHDALSGIAGKGTADFRRILYDRLLAEFDAMPSFAWSRTEKPGILLCVGINGAGKTTTCAKLAWNILRQGGTSLLGAGDTFRAAGADQLKIWGDRLGCPVVGGQTGGDAAAVAFDTVEAAISRHVDWAILDTAGRMHTRQPLMQELEKVRRAIQKRLPSAPHETWIVLDASVGQNALSQARQFHAAVPLTGVVVTKLDGSAKAGFLFAVRQELALPVRYVGLGEGADDLAPFDAKAFVGGLLGIEAGSGNAMP